MTRKRGRPRKSSQIEQVCVPMPQYNIPNQETHFNEDIRHSDMPTLNKNGEPRKKRGRKTLRLCPV